MPSSTTRGTTSGSASAGWAARLFGRLRPRRAAVAPSLFDAVSDPVLIVDAEDTVVFANRAVGLVLGYDPDELVGEGFAETLLLPDLREPHRARVQLYLKNGRDPVTASDGLVRVVRANGTEMEAEMALRAEAGAGRLAVCLRDRRSQRTAESALEAAENRQRTLRTIVDAIPDPVVAINRKGRVVLRNRAGAHAYVAPPESGGDAALPPDEWRKASAVMQSGEAVYGSEEPASGGRVRLATRVPVRDDAGAVVGLVTVSRDVTDQKAAEAALRDGKAAAEEAARANRDFLATTSHEVRTLMSGVTGMITLLQGTDLDDEQRDYVGTVESSSEALLAVINDVLDLSKMEAGMLTLENRPFRPRRLAKEALGLVAQQAEAKGLALGADVDEGVPDVVHGDGGRIRQVLANLLTNAVKFTPAGSVRIAVAPGPQTPEGGPTLAFSVADTGEGIAPERLSAVFERFEQADASTARTHGGTGLGLAICRQLVTSMGGELTAESALGEGSVFRFTVALGQAEPSPGPADAAWVARPAGASETDPLPAAPPPAEAPASPAAEAATPAEAAAPDEAEPPAPDTSRPERASVMSLDAVLPSARVLVVEDDDVLQRVTALTLRRLGYQPEVVGNGQLAVEAVRSQPFDVVLMDVMMPVMNGLDATRHIRQHPGPHPPPAIVALTANAMEEDRRKCLQAGCDDYLAKPVQPRHLASTIEKAIRLRAEGAPPAAPELEEDVVIS